MFAPKELLDALDAVNASHGSGHMDTPSVDMGGDKKDDDDKPDD